MLEFRIESIRHTPQNSDARDFFERFTCEEFYFIYNGRKVNSLPDVENGIVHIVPRLPGGKGGFGSMLRAIGAQIEKTTNREACRDLSGRRLRDINEEKRLKKWISEQADRDHDAKERKRKKLEKLGAEPKHDFKDSEYDKVRAEMVNKVYSAVEEGLKVQDSVPDEPSTSQGTKRKHTPKQATKGMFWIDGEELGSSTTDSEEENEDDKKKVKSCNL